MQTSTTVFNSLFCLGLAFFGCTVRAGTYYVVPASTPNHTAVHPYASWETAATNIADAVAVTEEDKSTMDTVYLTNGVHYITTPVETTDNRITIKSWDGNPETTIINGNYPENTSRAFYILAKQLGPAHIEGLTFTNCYSTGYGGAVYFRGANNGTISNCWFLGNVSAVRGGAVDIERAGFVKNCRFVGNISTSGGAVGVTSDAQTRIAFTGQPAIVDCLFSNNMSRGSGGAAISGAHNYLVSRCTIVDNVVSNTATAYGGAISLGAGGIVHASTIIRTRKAATSGGYLRGVAVASANNLNNALIDCIIENNEGGESSIHLLGGLSSLIENCTIQDNANEGAAVSGSMILRNTLIARNSKIGFASGNSVASSWGSIAENCTFTANGTVGYLITSGTLTNQLVNCIVQGNQSGIQWERGVNAQNPAFIVENTCLFPLPFGDNDFINDGVIMTDPMFRDAENGDYRLRAKSPCRNTGSNAPFWLAAANDLGGTNSRILEDVVDMGCYEYLEEHLCTVIAVR